MRVDSSNPMLVVSSRAAAVVLSIAIFTLVAASVAGQVLKYRFNHDHMFGLVNLFNLDGEMNLPTWYAATTLLTASVLLWIISRARRASGDGDARYWAGLAAIFLYLSADEAAFIHELLNPVLRPRHFLPGFLYYGWVVAGIAAVAVVGLLYTGFVLRLAAPVRRLFILSAFLFVGGSLGIEMLSAQYAWRQGTDNLEYALLTTLEEAMEMTGVAVFIYALLRQLSACGPVSLRAR